MWRRLTVISAPDLPVAVPSYYSRSLHFCSAGRWWDLVHRYWASADGASLQRLHFTSRCCDSMGGGGGPGGRGGPGVEHLGSTCSARAITSFE